MGVPSWFRCLRQSERRIRSVRNLVCQAAFIFSSIALASAQQPVAQPPASPEATAEASKPTTPQQKRLADDTAKLLTLANELKAELDKSSKDTLSLSVIRKAEQVEKLAHKVRDEMKAGQQN
jgi:hypothetical protein